MKKLGIILFNLIFYLFFTQVAFANTHYVETVSDKVPLPVKISASASSDVTTISICNTTAAAIPLKNVELSFTYNGEMSKSISGAPWVTWKVSQQGNQVFLLGESESVLQADPNCQKPMTISFDAKKNSALPMAPFVFKAAGAILREDEGRLRIKVPETPEAGLTKPVITLTGAGTTRSKTIAWNSEWNVRHLPVGSYTISSSTVSNGTHTYKADPITVNVTEHSNQKVTLKYTLVSTTLGNLTISLPAQPEAGLNNPQLTVQGMGKTFNQTVAWGAQWKLTDIPAGSYTVTSSTVTNGTHTYEASPVNVTVTTGGTAQVALTYKIVTPTLGNLTISIPAIPEAGLGNPQITVTGMGKTLNQTVAWGAQWQLTNLAVGTYTVTSSTVTNGTHSYQASPVSATVTVGATTQVTLKYTLVTPSTGNLTISLPAIPEAGLNNPELTVTGMGQTLKQTVAWGAQWALMNLTAGSYTVTSSTVSNGTHTYQANPVNATVTVGTTAQVSLAYTLVTGRPASWDNIKHVVFILFENTGAAETLQQPFFKSLLTRGAFLSKSFAVSHPSEPNYLALAGGSTFGVTDDANHNINAKHIGDLFVAKGLTWKAYAEGYPGNCFQGSSSGAYARKHEPFISFIDVQNNPTECAKVVPGPQFFTDLAANNLPTYSFYTPDENNDGHDTGVAFADRWFSTNFGPIFNNANVMSNTLFIVTFDEDSDNNIYTLFIGAGVKAGATSAVRYTHYSMLRTVEDIFQVGTLAANDQSAAVVNDIWLP